MPKNRIGSLWDLLQGLILIEVLVAAAVAVGTLAYLVIATCLRLLLLL